MSGMPSTDEDLKSLYQEPSRGALLKEYDYLDQYHQQFVELSPFLVLASSLPGGPADASPRGGPPAPNYELSMAQNAACNDSFLGFASLP
jgi:predicted pyridoxine 5'-phosphate oxidase superfamily flavin-nucleotide-binding protein